MRWKRPLCLFSLIFTFIIFLFQNLTAADYPEFIEDGSKITISGKVINKEYKNNRLICHLSHVTITDYGKDGLPEEKITVEADGRYLKVLCYMDSCAKEPMIFDRVFVKGSAALFEPASNEGQYDEKRAYQIKGYAFKLFNAVVLKEEINRVSLLEILCRIRRNISDHYKKVLGQENGSVLSAMILADRSEIDKEIKDLYRANGIAHMLAVSGLHISVIGLFFIKLLKKTGLTAGVASAAGIAVIILYGMLTGFPVSVFRASFMLILKLIADITGRSYDMLTALSFSGVLVLSVNSAYLSDAGFLLSFFALCGIALLYAPLAEILSADEDKKSFINRIKKAFAASLSVSFSTIPILLYYYFSFPVYSFILNIILLPLFSVIVIFALAGAAIRIPVLLMPSGLILDLYEAVCRFTMKLPFNTLITGRPGWGRIIVYYLLILTVIIPWKKTEKRDKMHLKTGKALILAAALVIIFIPRRASAGVDMLNVGQGDLIVMKDAKGSTVIYDGGSSDVDLTGKYRLLPYLKYNGVRHIDAVFLSHPHLDHYSALVELFENCEKEGIDVGALYVSHEYRFYPDEYRAVFDAAAKGDIPIIETDMEKDLTFGDILVRPVYPYEHTDTGDVNDSSLVLLAQINGFSILLTGDVTSRSDNELIACLDKRGVKHIDCLKVCHHGSAEANSQRLINRLSPSCALISCGFSYGHPHREVLDRLSKAGVKYHITRDEGQIRIKTHDNGFVLCKYPYL